MDDLLKLLQLRGNDLENLLKLLLLDVGELLQLVQLLGNCLERLLSDRTRTGTTRTRTDSFDPRTEATFRIQSLRA